jgi:SH3-like domain-containing protein
MKKYLHFLVLLILVLPTITYAAWWNPSTWFTAGDTWYAETYDTRPDTKVTTEISGEWKKELAEVQNPQPTSTKTTRFYIKSDNTRLRTCASLTCDIKGYYVKNNYIDVARSDTVQLNDLEEWLEIKEPDGSIGYLNKSVLSDKKIVESHTSTVKKVTATSNQITAKDREAINSWITDIDDQDEETADTLKLLYEKKFNVNPSIVADVLTDYQDNLRYIKQQINTSHQNIIADPQSYSVEIEKIKTYISRYQKIKDDFVPNLEIAFGTFMKKNSRAAEEKYEYVNDYYNEQRAQLNAINQAKVDAANAYVEKYNSIRNSASGRGVTESAVNNQLEAAGLIKQTHCTFSAVGGMTPGAGSMTCY